MSEIIAAWHAEISAELTEARTALGEAAAAATTAKERHQAAIATVETVKAALAHLQVPANTLALPITGRVDAAAAAAQQATMAARTAAARQQEAEARVGRLETAAEQLATVLAAATEPEEAPA